MAMLPSLRRSENHGTGRCSDKRREIKEYSEVITESDGMHDRKDNERAELDAAVVNIPSSNCISKKKGGSHGFGQSASSLGMDLSRVRDCMSVVRLKN